MPPPFYPVLVEVEV